MITRYLDPKIDLAFKRVFGEHPHLLKSFLNALLPLPEDDLIDTLEYLTPEQVPEVPGLYKNSIVDVKCRDLQGRTFIVEMQMLWTDAFASRILFEASQAYVKQLHQGRNYDSLQPVYALALVNQNFDHDSEHYLHHYQIVNLQQPKRVLKGLEFVFIELQKFKPQNALDRRMQAKWLRFMSEIGEYKTPSTLPAELQAQLQNPQDPQEQQENQDILEALKLVEVAAYSDAELEAYHVYQDRSRLEGTLMSGAKAEGKAEGLAQGKAEGLAEGIEKGLAEGIEKGLAEGKAQGLAEGKAEAQAQLIQAMLTGGMTTEQIRQITQLSQAQIERLMQKTQRPSGQ